MGEVAILAENVAESLVKYCKLIQVYCNWRQRGSFDKIHTVGKEFCRCVLRVKAKKGKAKL